MSLVLVTAMENYIIFMSDGRVTRNRGTLYPEILQETYKKLCRINDSICVGFAGSKEPCEEILEGLDKYDPNQIINLENVFNRIYDKAKSVYNKYTESGIPIKILMVVGGKQDNEIKFKYFSSVENFCIQQLCPKGDDLSYIMLSPDGVNISYLENEIKANIPCTIDNMKTAMSNCIDNVSKFNKTVNQFKFVEIIL